MNLITLLYVPLVLIGMHYLHVSMIGSLMVGMGMLLGGYGLFRNVTKEELLAPLFFTMIGGSAYIWNQPFTLKLYPLALSLVFLAYFLISFIRQTYPLIGWVERVKKRPLRDNERTDIIRSHVFWIGVLTLNTAIHCVLVFHENINWWAGYAFAGWYLLFGAAILLQIGYVHRIVILRIFRSFLGYGLFAGVIIAGFIPALSAYLWMRLKKDPKPHIVFQRVVSAMFRIFFRWVPGGGEIRQSIDPKVKSDARYIYVATHESWLDYPLMGSFIGDLFHLTNKKKAFVWFLLPVSRLLGVTDAIGQNALYPLLHCLRDNSNVLIFPEGSRSIDGSLGRFKMGAFALSIAANVPVVPVIIEGTRNIVPKGSYLWTPSSSGIIRVSMLEPMGVLEDEDVAAFACRVREKMASTKVLMQKSRNG